jgi:hypothetical protein
MSTPDDGSGGLDAAMRAAVLSVFCSGLCIAVIAAAVWGLRAGLGAAIGGVLATANLAVFARMGQAFIGGKGRKAPWGVIALFKLVVLFGGVWLLLKTGLVPGVALAAGYAALPLGVALGSFLGPRPPDGDPPETDDQESPRPPAARM